MMKSKTAIEETGLTLFAFLRGINVGGKNIIRMDELAEAFLSLGFTHVKTYIQSGNIRFQAYESNIASINERIKIQLKRIFGYEGTVMLRTLEEMIFLLKSNPFREIVNDKKVKFYVSFLYEKPSNVPVLPLVSEKDGMEVFYICGKEAFILSREVKGSYGFPNNFIEKVLGIPATTRNWNTIEKMPG